MQMMQSGRFKKMAAAPAWLPTVLWCACAAQAQDDTRTSPVPPALYMQAAQAEHSTHAFTVGAMLPWQGWQTALWGFAVRGHWDIAVSRLSFTAAPGRASHMTALTAVPTLRLHWDSGRSPWFWEAGLGAMTSSRRYITAYKSFGSRLNFASHMGLGRHFGARGQHQLSLRVQHFSNAGLKGSNPGEDAIQLRYVRVWGGG